MSGQVLYEVTEGIAVITIASPPLNILTLPIRSALVAAIGRAADDPGVEAVVLCGKGGALSGGIDPQDYDAPLETPDLQALCRAIEECPRPVVAALGGLVVGAGFELALAAHYRVASASARIGMPEVVLGLVPSGGATQRLPRLGGAARALDLLLTGKPVSVTDPAGRFFVDVVTEGDARLEAMAQARRVLRDGMGIRRTRAQTRGLADAQSFQTEIAARRATLPDAPGNAASQILRCVDSALVLPFEAGLKLESELAEVCRASDRSEGLRHIYRAERQLSRLPELREARGWPIRTMGLVGGGTLATELAVVALDAGMAVRMHGVDDAGLEAGHTAVAAIYNRAVSRGRLSDRLRQGRLGRLSLTRALDDAASSDLVVDTTGADHHSRALLLQRLMARAPDHTIVLTTGPCARLAELAAGTGVPTHVLGLRTAGPAHVMRLVELAVHDAVAPDVVAACVMALRRMSRVPLRTGPRDVPVAQTMWLALVQAALSLADTGVHPYRIEAALRDHGLRTGPFQWIDDTGLSEVQEQLTASGWPGGTVLRGMIRAGRGGRAAGAGFLLYPDGAGGAPDPDRGLADLLRGMRPDRGLGDEDVVAVCMAVLANAGAALLREGQVSRPADLDVAMVYGHGFPRAMGGPMKAADLAGLFTVQRRLERFADRTHAGFAPDDKLKELVRNGLLFSDLDG